ncbi:hypothetical protein FB45DRAFT_1067505 [Roridomyces roridus]|uniref:Uncharacterized protein n=1 Tax=Roridomyces roridus TaxID=1738132 RepID=A0AAD7B2F0_9AGAR|nr:hypothetical protein FB45DRAFT_1067505 [Roridomyces roridus]
MTLPKQWPFKLRYKTCAPNFGGVAEKQPPLEIQDCHLRPGSIYRRASPAAPQRTTCVDPRLTFNGCLTEVYIRQAEDLISQLAWDLFRQPPGLSRVAISSGRTSKGIKPFSFFPRVSTTLRPPTASPRTRRPATFLRHSLTAPPSPPKSSNVSLAGVNRPVMATLFTLGHAEEDEGSLEKPTLNTPSTRASTCLSTAQAHPVASRRQLPALLAPLEGGEPPRKRRRCDW